MGKSTVQFTTEKLAAFISTQHRYVKEDPCTVSVWEKTKNRKLFFAPNIRTVFYFILRLYLTKKKKEKEENKEEYKPQIYYMTLI